ncbi:MAG: DoxX family protein [Bacteroidota bacterium]|nr:DoxX family protein [Bacteroidota bacterium]
MKIITTIARILVGLLFIFSGLIKANDPLGFSYKLKEYFEVFGLHFLVPAALFLAIFICVFEVALGFMLLIGARVKLTLWLSLLMIVFFTFLTFYSAYFNVVKECGCFGDFLHLTPWTSFYKDLALLILLIILFIGKQYINPLVGPRFENVLIILIIAASIAFPVYTYSYLPVKDFRPYKVGTDIYKATHPEVKYFYKLKNKKSGETKEFDKWPENWDQEWDYVDSRTENLDPNFKEIIGFAMNNKYGENYADEFLQKTGYKFILVAYDLDKTNRDVQGRVNDFAAMCAMDSIEFAGLTSSDSLKTYNFAKENNNTFTYYLNGDDVPLKTMIRSNPGLMLLKDATVIEMWHHNSFPSFNDVKEKYFKK